MFDQRPRYVRTVDLFSHTILLHGSPSRKCRCTVRCATKALVAAHDVRLIRGYHCRSCSTADPILMKPKPHPRGTTLIPVFLFHRPCQGRSRATRSYRNGILTALRPGKLLATTRMSTFARVPYSPIHSEVEITSSSCARLGIRMEAPTNSITAMNVSG